MSKKHDMELTLGSEYKILSIGGRDSILETEGLFEGFISVGVDEIGVVMRLSKKHGDMKDKLRIIPLHVILAIDVFEVKPNEKKDFDKERPNYVG
jgi:hypothetical protein